MSLVTCVECNNQLSPELKACPSCGTNCGTPAAQNTATKSNEITPLKLTVLSACAIASAVVAPFFPFLLGKLVFTAIAGILGYIALSKNQKRTGTVALALAAITLVGILHMSYKSYQDKVELHQIEEAQAVQK